ncbi:unnamed protein product [Spodoptera littoralis]|uniref:CDK5 regulatory subunit-associated protein 3 n=1 Tax=Spodoptera littoralis TaxID=7109 RepID=A0A9P0HX14_SPOLI|nr:unnamed protein product [Spodoptera littoralis]CAH1635547.1 unnamed protein product [Spodoptera littoralis]
MDESNIPIDINIGKLQDWLVSRRHVSKEWQKGVPAVREKINNALQDMPKHDDIASLLAGSYINYFHCLKIIEILKETEADSKNLFGRYGSQRMKDWQDIARNYERDNLYLAEAAQILVRNINYEIPGLKKQITKEEQLQVECEKKHSDFLKNEASSKTEFLTLCKQLGIQGERIKKELIGTSLKPLQPAIDLYAAFSKYILGDRATEVLPLLQFVVEHGNTTMYEWSYGEAPLSVEPDPIHIEIDDEDQGAGDQIDFGSLDAPAEIDFGDGDAGAEIDWGNIDVAAPENILESFLKMRLYETNTSGDNHSFSLLEQLPTESTAALTAMLDAVQVAASKLTAPEMNHLHNVKHSPRYVDVLTAQLKQKLALCDKLSRLASRAADQSAAAGARATELRPVLTRIIARTKELQAQIESEISKKYKGRPVNIIGGVKFL